MVLNQREGRFLSFYPEALIQDIPLLFDLILSILLLFLLLLRLNCELFELVAIHFHVGAYDLVSDGGYGLIPVLLLRAVEQALHNDWVCLLNVVLYQLLHCLRIQKQQGALSRLIVHSLARQ